VYETLSPFGIRNQVSRPYEVTGKIMFMFVYIASNWASVLFTQYINIVTQTRS
jgi:hypothetical protein